MLMVTGLETEITAQGARHMLSLASPGGQHFRVEVDEGTRERVGVVLQTLCNQALKAARASETEPTEPTEPSDPDEEPPPLEPGNRIAQHLR